MGKFLLLVSNAPRAVEYSCAHARWRHGLVLLVEPSTVNYFQTGATVRVSRSRPDQVDSQVGNVVGLYAFMTASLRGKNPWGRSMFRRPFCYVLGRYAI